MDKQREMFEAWWQENRPSCWSADWYAKMQQDMAWDAWQAAIAAQSVVPNVTDVARAIWDIRREEEDRCDMELEDVGTYHSVWREAESVCAMLSYAPEPTK